MLLQELFKHFTVVHTVLEVYFFLLLNHPSADLKSLVLIFMVITKQIIWVRKLLSAFKILKHAGVLAKR